MCCTDYSQLPSFAENTTFTCTMLQRGLNWELTQLIAKLTTGAHQISTWLSRTISFCSRTERGIPPCEASSSPKKILPLSPSKKGEGSSAAATTVPSAAVVLLAGDGGDLAHHSLFWRHQGSPSGGVHGRRREGDGSRPVSGELPPEDNSIQALCIPEYRHPPTSGPSQTIFREVSIACIRLDVVCEPDGLLYLNILFYDTWCILFL
jgi:hypothetical protein